MGEILWEQVDDVLAIVHFATTYAHDPQKNGCRAQLLQRKSVLPVVPCRHVQGEAQHEDRRPTNDRADAEGQCFRHVV